MIQLATLYTATGLLKSGPTWHRDHTALYYALVNPYNRHFDAAELWASMQSWMLGPMTAVVVWWETLFAVFLVVHALRHELRRRLGPRRWLVDLRIPMLGFGIAMHVGIQMAMYVAWFSPLVIASYLVFLTPDEARWVGRRLARRGLSRRCRGSRCCRCTSRPGGCSRCCRTRTGSAASRCRRSP
jgi:hypothetical protein